jgi:hypothetical protein
MRQSLPALLRWAGLPCLPHPAQEALERVANKTSQAARASLEQTVAQRRPVAGLGRRSHGQRLFVSLPGSGAVDAKLDVPTLALIGGWRWWVGGWLAGQCLGEWLGGQWP